MFRGRWTEPPRSIGPVSYTHLDVYKRQADGCIATNRITVEGYKVGYCYREKPDGGWDSGWRFTAGDESEEYMDDPNNAGIYKLNTICNDDPDIIPLLHTPAPCAFERDENGVFQPVSYTHLDPIYHQNHIFEVWQVEIDGQVYRFAAGEFSNCMWGFYLEKN